MNELFTKVNRVWGEAKGIGQHPKVSSCMQRKGSRVVTAVVLYASESPAELVKT